MGGAIRVYIALPSLNPHQSVCILNPSDLAPKTLKNPH